MELINSKYNKWTVVSSQEKDKWGSSIVLCRCECGFERKNILNDIVRNKSTQCRSCSYRYGKKRDSEILFPFPLSRGNNYRHGMYGTTTYRCWASMVKRCKEDVGKNFKWYASRGIKVCDRWLKFENFYKDMGEKPYKYYIDRIDNDLGYFKENCRWVDSYMNSRNRRCVKNK